MVWSTGAIVGLTLAIARGAPPLAFLFLSISLGFCGVWCHYAIRFRQLARAPLDTDSDPAPALGDESLEPPVAPEPGIAGEEAAVKPDPTPTP